MASKVQSENVNVAIYGSTYTLRGGTDVEAVRTLAAEVDARMRELAPPGSSADPLKVAVLTALRLADDIRTAKEEGERREEEIAGRVKACADRIARALSTGGAPDPRSSDATLDEGSALG